MSTTVLSRAEYILYTTSYSTPYLREDLGCELMVGGGEREALFFIVCIVTCIYTILIE